MRRYAGWVVLIVGLLSATADAGWREFWHRVHVDWHRNNAWPEPFQEVDREAVRMNVLASVGTGWQLQNTLADELFDTETQELLPAGETKIRSILLNSPRDRRTVYVYRGATRTATSIRLDSVQRAASRLVDEGPLPPVLVTDVPAPSHSGDYYDQIERRVRASVPTPRLTNSISSGNGTGAGGGAATPAATGGGTATGTGN